MSWVLLDTARALGHPFDVLLYTFHLKFLRLKIKLVFLQKSAGIIIYIF